MKYLTIFFLSTILNSFANDIDVGFHQVSKGKALLIRTQFRDFNVIEELNITGDAADKMFEQMVRINSQSHSNSCNGQEVKVLKKIGASITCEEWPASCWGKKYHSCKISLRLDKGRAN